MKDLVPVEAPALEGELIRGQFKICQECGQKAWLVSSGIAYIHMCGPAEPPKRDRHAAITACLVWCPVGLLAWAGIACLLLW